MKLVGLVGALAMLAPVGASAMPAAGSAMAPSPSLSQGAKIEKAEIVVRTGPRVVRPRLAPRVVVRPRAVVRPGPRVIVR